MKKLQNNDDNEPRKMFRELKLCVSERLLLNARQVIMVMEAMLRIAFGLGSAEIRKRE